MDEWRETHWSAEEILDGVVVSRVGIMRWRWGLGAYLNDLASAE